MVGVGMKYVLAVTAARDNVVKASFEFKPRFPCHQAKILTDRRISQYIAGLIA